MSELKLRRGVLIAVEGIDGAGKTTLSDRLVARLRAAGLVVHQTHEPTRGPHGQRLRRSAQEGRLEPRQELELFLLDRAEHVRALIAPALDAGEVVVTDRYYFSTIAYQSIRGLDPDMIRERNEAIAPRPDHLLVLEVPVDVALERIEQGRGEVPNAFERPAALARCQARFIEDAARLPDRALVIEATRDPGSLVDESARWLLEGTLGERLREVGAAAALAALSSGGVVVGG